MVDTRASVLGSSLSPDRVARAEFSSSFRGFDPTEVRSFLARVAGEFRALAEREEALRERVGELEKPQPVERPEFDEHHLTEQLGAEAAKVLEAARNASLEIRNKAQAEADERLTNSTAEADRLVSQARADADAVLESANLVLGERTAEAEAAAASIMAAAQADAERVRGEAVRERDQARADALAEVDAARQDGRRMVAEARAVRERILTDMARRRNVSRQQVERLRAARERLLESVDGVRRSVDQVTVELNGALVDAKLAGDRAARAVDVNFVPPLHELEAEVETAKDTGLIDADAVDRQLSALTTGEQPAVVLDDDLTEDAAFAVVDDAAPAEPAPDAEASVVLEIEDVFGEEDDPVDGVGAEDLAALDELDAIELTEPEGGDGAEGLSEPNVPDEQVPADAVPDDAVIDLTDGGGSPRPEITSALDDVFTRLRTSSDTPATPTPAKSTESKRRPKGSNRQRKAVEANGHGAVLLADTLEDEVIEVETPSAEAEDAMKVAAEPDAPAGEEPVVSTQDQVLVQTRDAVLAGVVRDLARQLKLSLSDEQNEILELVGGRGSSKTRLEDLPDIDQRRGAYALLSERELTQAAGAGWRSIDPDSEPVVDLSEVAKSVAADLVDTVRARIADGFDDREGLPDLVRAAYRDIRNLRLAEVTEHAGLVAYAVGQFAALQATEPAQEVRWVFDSCSPDCLDNSLATAVRAGEPFPTGHLHPPAFVGCRCALLPGSPS